MEKRKRPGIIFFDNTNCAITGQIDIYPQQRRPIAEFLAVDAV
jgi:hypothetical protein